MRKGGLEPPRPCGRQPLKLVRLPIPPLPREEPETRNSERSAFEVTCRTATAASVLAPGPESEPVPVPAAPVPAAPVPAAPVPAAHGRR